MPVRIYDSPEYENNVLGLIMRQGNAAAAARAHSADVWGRTLVNLGQIAGAAVQQHKDQQQADAEQTAAAQREGSFRQFVDEGAWHEDPESLISAATAAYGTEKGPRVAQAYLGAQDTIAKAKTQAQKAQAEKNKALATLARGAADFIGTPHENDALQMALKTASESELVTPQELQSLTTRLKQSPELVPQVLQSIIDRDPEVAKEYRETNKGQMVTTVDPATGQTVQRMASASELRKGVPTAPKPRNIQALDSTVKDPNKALVFVSQEDIDKEPRRFQPIRTGVNVNVGGGGISTHGGHV